MAVKNPKILVVDTDVFSAASGKNATDPTPIQCRDFLQEILKTGHFVLVTDAVYAEWQRHSSPFADNSFTTMRQRGKVKRVRGEIVDHDLRDKIFAVIQKHMIPIVTKDMHLIESARMADEIIASRDNVRQHFHAAAIHIEELQSIVWVNPTVEAEDCIVWLRQSAPADDFRKLSYVQTSDDE